MLSSRVSVALPTMVVLCEVWEIELPKSANRCSQIEELKFRMCTSAQMLQEPNIGGTFYLKPPFAQTVNFAPFCESKNCIEFIPWDC